MATVPLSLQTKRRLDLLFDGEEAVLAADLLVNECGSNLPFCDNLGPTELEPIRFADMKLSDGHLDRLLEAIELAQQDWRDLLMAAGFGEDVNAHKRWLEQGTEGGRS